MQGTLIRSLVCEDPTCHGATKPIDTTTEPMRPKAHAPQQEKPPQWEAYSLQLELPLLTTTRESLHAATKI